jgi:pre-mRNA-splicing factor ATP-dependent RNA helicase DHX15/PRP43
LALTLVAAGKYGVASEALSLVAMMSVPQCYLRPKDAADEADAAKAQFIHEDGDHMTLLTTFQVYLEMKRSLGEGVAGWCRENFLNPRTMKSAESVRQQLERINVRLGIPTNSTVGKSCSSAVRKALLSGFFLQVAHVVPNKSIYLPVNGKSQVALHPSTVIMNKPEWVVYNEYVVTSRNYIRTCTQIRPEWLFEIAPHYFNRDNIENDMTRSLLSRSNSSNRF